MTSTEFVDAVKAMDTKNTLTIEKTDNDYIPSTPYLYFYKIKPSTNNTELRVVFSELEEDEAKEMGIKNNEIHSIILMLNDENLVISSDLNDSYSITLESLNPIVTEENISEFKEPNDYDKKFLKLQNTFISNKNMTAKDIEELWNQKFEEDKEILIGQVDSLEDYEDASAILLEDHEDSTISVLLKRKNELVDATCSSSEFLYGYEAKEIVDNRETTINDNKYYARLHANDKASLISQIEKLYTIGKK